MPGPGRIFAGVSGSPGSVHALRYAADLAGQHDAMLIPLHTWVPPDGDRHERKHPCVELGQLWRDDAWQRLWQAFDTAFGGLPAGILVHPAVVRGGRSLTIPVSHGQVRTGSDVPIRTPRRGGA